MPRRLLLPTTGLIALLLLACDGTGAVPSAAGRSHGRDAIVGRASVTDGDTFVIRGQRIRLWGVDAPEARQRCYRPDGGEWRCGTAAANALSEWLGPRPLTCVRKGRSYDRVVARCSVDGQDVGAWLVRNGWALDYRQFSRGRYRSEERQAADARSGMHAGFFQPPWEFRRRGRGDRR